MTDLSELGEEGEPQRPVLRSLSSSDTKDHRRQNMSVWSTAKNDECLFCLNPCKIQMKGCREGWDIIQVQNISLKVNSNLNTACWPRTFKVTWPPSTFCAACWFLALSACFRASVLPASLQHCLLPSGPLPASWAQTCGSCSGRNYGGDQQISEPHVNRANKVSFSARTCNWASRGMEDAENDAVTFVRSKTK